MFQSIQPTDTMEKEPFEWNINAIALLGMLFAASAPEYFTGSRAHYLMETKIHKIQFVELLIESNR